MMLICKFSTLDNETAKVLKFSFSSLKIISFIKCSLSKCPMSAMSICRSAEWKS